MPDHNALNLCSRYIARFWRRGVDHRVGENGALSTSTTKSVQVVLCRMESPTLLQFSAVRGVPGIFLMLYSEYFYVVPNAHHEIASFAPD